MNAAIQRQSVESVDVPHVAHAKRPLFASIAAVPSELQEATAVAESDYEWLPPARAARALSISKTKLLSQASRGKLAMRIGEHGWREFKVTRAAIREMIAVRQRSDANLLAATIVERSAMEGKTVTEICVEFRCLPKFIAKTLAELREAEEEQREDDKRRRAYELLTGDLNIPTNWAWIADRFARGYTYEKATSEMESFEYRGGDKTAVSPLVRRALSNETAWLTALALWKRHESTVVAQHIEEETAKRGLQTRHALVEIWDKEQKHLEAGERMRRNQQREDDRHQGHQETSVAKRRGRPKGSKNKPKFTMEEGGE